MKDENMKTSKTLIAVIAGAALFVGAAHAQYNATGDDGVTASPKLREMINGQAGVSVRPAAPASVKHSCATCKEEYVTRVDSIAKGAYKPKMLIAKHLCPGCETTISVTGHGKAARNVVKHKCTSRGEGSAACCTAKKT